MTKDISNREQTAIGLDVGDRYSRYCILDGTGAITEEGRLSTTKSVLAQRFSALEPARVALEVGTHSPWISRLVEECGHQVYVANPRKLRLIYENDRKSDRVDAEWLARIARLDPRLLSPVRHRGKETQAALALLRSRDGLVRSRTLLVNHVRGAVKSSGGRLPKCSPESLPRKAVSAVPKGLEPTLTPVLNTIAMITSEIRRYEQHIELVSREDYPETELLRQVPGIGPITALTYVLTLEDPSRFPNSRTVGAYLGLTRRCRQSGGQDPECRITKAGDQTLRCLLVQCAHWILGPFAPDSDLRRWGLALARRGRKSAKRRAVIAVARKLSVLLHRLWLTGEVYEPIGYSGRQRQLPSSIS